MVRVDAPPGAKIAWFSGGGNFCAHQGGGAPDTRNAMAYALDAPDGFTEFYRAQVPAGQDHWHYNADVEVRPERAAKTVFIRYVGDPGVNNLRIYAHCLDDAPPPPAPVSITHVWTEAGARKEKTVTLDGPGGYEITCDADPTDESIEMSVPGDAR